METITGVPLEASQNTITERVLSTVASEADEDVLDLPPLYEVVDADALEELFAREPAPSLTVQFDYTGYQVTISDGRVSVVEQ